MNLIWDIKKIECYVKSQGKTNCVHTIYYTIEGTRDGVTASLYKVISIAQDVTGVYVPFNELTLEAALQMVKNNLGLEGLKAIDDEITAKIALLIAPVNSSPALPWAI